jgi:hypothetical protein
MKSNTQLVRPTTSDLSSRSSNKVILTWESTPTLLGGKKNPMQGLITKMSTAEVTLSGTGIYAARKVDEGEFSSSDEVKKRTWGMRVGNSCIIEHNGKMYVEFLVDGTPKTSYLYKNPDTNKLEDIKKEDIQGLKPSHRDSNVLICCVPCDNIKILSEQAKSSD